MSNIRFSKNWNNKLELVYFTTIRMHTKNKFNYYKKEKDSNSVFNILLRGEKKGEAYLVDMEVNELMYIPEWLCLIDAGLNKEEFSKLMEEMYKEKYKEEWKGPNTLFIILCFKRIIKEEKNEGQKRIGEELQKVV